MSVITGPPATRRLLAAAGIDDSFKAILVENSSTTSAESLKFGGVMIAFVIVLCAVLNN